jgi:hypothetical protein
MFSELRTWPARRWSIAGGTAIAAFVGLAVASGTITVAGGLGFAAPFWAYLASAVGSGLLGLVVASYIAPPIGADATLCDLRWPVLALIGLSLSTDVRTAVPLLTGVERPAVAVTAVALLVWALVERLRLEHRVVLARERASRSGVDSVDGEVCTTCRPLFPRRGSRSDLEPAAEPIDSVPTPDPPLKEVAP